MFLKPLFLVMIGFTSGLAVAGGSFALIATLCIVPRIIGKSSTAAKIFHYENAIILGGIWGNVVTVYTNLKIPLGRPFLILYGLGSGIQVGCLIMALAEIMSVFPIMFRRLKLKIGMSGVITAMAFGKVFGGLWYFFHGIGG